jgi:hypothetical protein
MRNNVATALKGPFLTRGTVKATAVQVEEADGRATVSVTYGPDSHLKELSWTIAGNGWATLRYRANSGGSARFYGIDFTFPLTTAKKWHRFGLGPHRVWKNRLPGGTYGFWSNANKTLDPRVRWDHPAFNGFFADVVWAAYDTAAGQLEWAVEDAPYFRNGNAHVGEFFKSYNGIEFPKHQISILHAIPSIPSKWSGYANSGTGIPHNRVENPYGDTIHLRLSDGAGAGK